jgi:uncharacterized protein with HEPN domain
MLTAIVEHIDNAIADSRKHTTYEDLSLDRVSQNSIAMEIIQVAELSKKIDQEFSRNHPDIPWRELRGLRNRLVHEYDQIEWDIVFNTVRDDLPLFRKSLVKVIEDHHDARPAHTSHDAFSQAAEITPKKQ